MNAWPPQASYPCGVPPQSNSPPATVPGAGHARRGRALDTRSESPLGARLPASPESHSYSRRLPRFIEFLHFDIQSTGQKSHRATRRGPARTGPSGRRSWGDPRRARRAPRVAADRRTRSPPPARLPPGGRARRAAHRASGGGERRATGRLLPQPRREPSPASHPSPTDPALRANPYPEVTDLICRLPLTTLASELTDAAGTATLSRARAPLSGRTHSRAPCPSQRKENSPRGSRQLLRDRLRYRTGRLARLSPPLQIRDLNPTPFDRPGRRGHRPTLPNGVRPSLRTD
ncbi:hypothetical protein Q5P01_000067 [Channa striata]|uniref:Uncharacterized protein n=1 Tax=Channa striata TaxID=64152 RepID=A0AA88LM25_CHASR|nr:hypothetical protein Q5P01_000067 [Channa striata]